MRVFVLLRYDEDSDEHEVAGVFDEAQYRRQKIKFEGNPNYYWEQFVLNEYGIEGISDAPA